VILIKSRSRTVVGRVQRPRHVVRSEPGSRAGESEPAKTFTVVFYGSAIFCCKTAQFSETLRESRCLELPLENRLRNVAKTCAKTR
jgi:hypothetical protein